MKKYIFLILLIGTIAGGLLYSLHDESYTYYEKAKALYDEGKYVEANEMLEIGLRKNQLNRKIIALKGKVYPIVEGAQNFKEASRLYDEAVNLALEGKIDAAKLSMSKAYELAGKVTTSSQVYDQAQELLRKIARDSTLVLDSATETEYKNALKHEAKGDLTRAYVALGNIEVKNEKVRRKMSEIAYRLGEARMRELKSAGTANEHIVQDAVYWYSQVQNFDDNYANATEKINELKLMNTK